MVSRSALAFALCCCSASWASLDLTLPTSQWQRVPYSGVNQFDIGNEHQTGIPEADLVGDALHGLLYTQFNDLNTPSLTDGTWGFRVRVGLSRPQVNTFDNIVLVGFDVGLNGSVDFFVACVRTNSQNQYNAVLLATGTGPNANTSPNTTALSSPLNRENHNAQNFDFRLVSATSDDAVDPLLLNTDLDNDGDTDRFVSFSINFASVTALVPQLRPDHPGSLHCRDEPADQCSESGHRRSRRQLFGQQHQDLGGFRRAYRSVHSFRPGA